jgi:hypothetical protein
MDSDSAEPDYTLLEQHLTNLLNLARNVLNPKAYPNRRRISAFLAADKLARLQERLDGYFSKSPDEESRSGSGWARLYEFYVMEMQVLVRMVTTALGLSAGKA